jgi:hypothetical protein
VFHVIARASCSIVFIRNAHKATIRNGKPHHVKAANNSEVIKSTELGFEYITSDTGRREEASENGGWDAELKA